MQTSSAFASPVSASTSSITAAPIHDSRGSYWVAPFAQRFAARCARRKRATIVQLCAANEVPPDESLTKEEKEHMELIKKLDPKELKWSEIPFGSVQEELDAVDEYEREEGLEPDSVWPKFLRGAAYEHWGQPHLALAQYSKVPAGTELSKVPQLWERKAYNSFKIGKVDEANAYCDIALTIYGQSVGNELHFAHWFNANFQDYLPKWNGPHANVQRGICKYCVGMDKGARECLVSQIALAGAELEHAILWFLAASVRMAEDGIAPEWDMKMVHRALKAEYDWDPRLRLFMDLFVAHATGVFGEVAEIEERLSNAIKKDDGDDIVSKVYIALYHDAFTKDHEERDRALDEAVALGSSRYQNDTENFLFCAAKNRLSGTASSKSSAFE
ncbi:hypothetical protein FGB62_58g130 [Gracilaria domingensis]|nr:hypothetical protein FGB62_58g130 [Gracilaria domingensis]